jgi:hypothetical protein
MCHKFQYFEEVMNFFGEKNQVELYICMKWKGTDTDLNRQVLAADPNPKKDADPTGSGSVLQHYGTKNINLIIYVNTFKKPDFVNL